MKRLLLTAALALASCGEAPGPSDSGTELTAFQRETIDAHNAVRTAAMPVPSPALEPMTWSESAAALAANWAARCEFEHRNPNSLGENLSAATNDRSITAVVNNWADEKADYTYATNTCASGKQCGHYTQIVWRSSVAVGCAIARCTTGSPFGGGAWSFIVCNYEPAGNFVGQKPY